MNHKARKRFGQNFLQDAGIIQQIIQGINPQANQNIVEIGPGEGALTELVLDKIGAMDVVELDRDLIPLLKIRFVLQEGLNIHQADALKFNFGQGKSPFSSFLTTEKYIEVYLSVRKIKEKIKSGELKKLRGESVNEIIGSELRVGAETVKLIRKDKRLRQWFSSSEIT